MGRLHEALFFGIHALLGTGTNKAWRFLLDSECIGREELFRQRDREVAATWELLRTKSRFFAERLPSSPLLDASSGRIRQDVWRQAPVVTREDLHKSLADMTAFPDEQTRQLFLTQGILPRGWRVEKSGGSSGQPVECIQDPMWRAFNRAAALWCDKLSGVWPCRENRLKLWGSPTEIAAAKSSVVSRASAWLQRSEILPCFRLDEARMRSHLEVINRRTDVTTIEGYSSVLFTIAQFAIAENIQVRPIRRVISSAGTLTPEMRDHIEKAFHAPVFNRYGSRDGGATANQCELRSGLHICEPTLYLEVVDADGMPVPDGEEGEILITQIRNRAMPLFRYRIGDVGVLDPDPCPCGRPHRVLKAVLGRACERVRTPNGKILDHSYFLHLFGVVLNTGWLDRFQVVQHALDKVEVKLVPRVKADSDSIARGIMEIRNELTQAFGTEVELLIRCVNEISPLPSGKYLYVVSLETLKNPSGHRVT